MDEKKSRVLIIGATGNLGYHLAEFSLKFSHPTFVLVRDSAFNDPVKVQKLQSLSDCGATLIKGSLEDEKSLLEAVKQVEVVICSIPSKHVLEQMVLVRVIKEAGCIKDNFRGSTFISYGYIKTRTSLPKWGEDLLAKA